MAHQIIEGPPTAIATEIGIGVVQDFLFGNVNILIKLHGIGVLEGGGGSKRPATSALPLTFDFSDEAHLPPVD